MGFNNLLKEKATIQSFTETQNEFGESEKTWVNKNENVPCRVKANKTTQKNDIGQYVIAPFTIYMPIEIDIENKDRITVSETTYEIIDVQSDSSKHHWQLQCKTIKD